MHGIARLTLCCISRCLRRSWGLGRGLWGGRRLMAGIMGSLSGLGMSLLGALLGSLMGSDCLYTGYDI